MAGNWIAQATQNKGALRRKLKVKAGKKIPAKDLVVRSTDSPTLAREKNLAKTLRHLNHG